MNFTEEIKITQGANKYCATPRKWKIIKTQNERFKHLIKYSK